MNVDVVTGVRAGAVCTAVTAVTPFAAVTAVLVGEIVGAASSAAGE
jgi:hypothetical protein